MASLCVWPSRSGARESSANNVQSSGTVVSAARRSLADCAKPTLSLECDALLKKVLNLVFRDDLERRGFQFAPASGKPLSQEKGMPCV